MLSHLEMGRVSVLTLELRGVFEIAGLMSDVKLYRPSYIVIVLHDWDCTGEGNLLQGKAVVKPIITSDTTVTPRSLL